MKERDCTNCKHHTEDGCSSWDCEFEAIDLISRADAIAYIDKIINSGLGRNKSLDYIHKYISALPSADTVSREEYNDLLRTKISFANATIPTFKESEEAYKAWTGEEIGKTSDEINEMNKEIIKDILKMMPTAYLLEALGVDTVDELMKPDDAVTELPSADVVSREDYDIAVKFANNLCKEFMAECERCETDRPHGEWTPVCSELPEMNEDVLVTLWGNQLEIGYFTFGERGIGLMFCANDFEIRGDESVFEEVDAWMPLPKPYKGGDTK